jgi:hypothetical protein
MHTYVYTHTHTHTHTHAHRRLHMSADKPEYQRPVSLALGLFTPTCTPTCTHIHTHSHTHAHAHMLVHTCFHVSADNPEFRRRVSLALGLMVGAKVLNVSVPVLMKSAVDALAPLSAAGDALTMPGRCSNLTFFVLSFWA